MKHDWEMGGREMSERPTPETDEELFDWYRQDVCYADFARKLERERDEAREESKRLEAICVSVHDRLLRGDDDSGLLKILEEAWQKAARHKEAAK